MYFCRALALDYLGQALLLNYNIYTMTKLEFLEQVSEFLELEGELELTEQTSIEELLEVDSLAHVTLISLIKDKFNVELSAEDFNKFENVADIIQKIGAQKFN